MVLNAGQPGNEAIVIRQNKSLNNLVEQEHRAIKLRTRPMLGFKLFRRAQTILAGIELVHMIRKGAVAEPGWVPAFNRRTILSVDSLKNRHRRF